jgi:hypothetical protein
VARYCWLHIQLAEYAGAKLEITNVKRFEVTLRARQGQRLFRRLRFRLRKPRPTIAEAARKSKRS